VPAVTYVEENWARARRVRRAAAAAIVRSAELAEERARRAVGLGDRVSAERERARRARAKELVARLRSESGGPAS
jgi:hypothetical protein